MSNLTPDELIYNKLLTLFDASVIGVGPVVYHADGEPIPPYVVYRRTQTEYNRDLKGNPHMQTVEYDIEIASQFFNEIDVDFSSLDNWTDSNWIFNLSNDYTNEDEFTNTYTVIAVKAF